MSDRNDNLDPEGHDPNCAEGRDPINEQAKIVNQSPGLRAVVLELREQLLAVFTSYPEVPAADSDVETREAFQAQLRVRPRRIEMLRRQLDEAHARLTVDGESRDPVEVTVRERYVVAALRFHEPDPVLLPTPPGPPRCCGDEMTSIGSGHAAGFDIEVWRCLICERHQSSVVRIDGKSFWVGAMGRAIRKEELRIIADSYGGPPAADPRP